MSTKATHKDFKKIAKENTKIMREFEKKKKRKVIPESEYKCEMSNPDNILEIDNLHTYFFTDMGTVKSVSGVTFEIPRGKTVALVGESGCGKSVTSLSLMGLLQAPQGQVVEGSIKYNSSNGALDLTKIPTNLMNSIRGNDISMIFQEPMTSLNPIFTVGDQIDEVLLLHKKTTTKQETKERTLELLSLVGIAGGERIYAAYPHELSGGMRQRIVIAMALACDPELIIADEPTTALDVTIQAQILDLLRNVKDQVNSSILLITHDLGVVAEMADYVVVMYAGRIVEYGTVNEIYENPSHPYTVGLLKSKPVINKSVDRLYSIPGAVPNPISMPNHCYFKDRCQDCMAECSGLFPETKNLTPTHQVSCWKYLKEAK